MGAHISRSDAPLRERTIGERAPGLSAPAALAAVRLLRVAYSLNSAVSFFGTGRFFSRTYCGSPLR
jgi:hypothetical protein